MGKRPPKREQVTPQQRQRQMRLPEFDDLEESFKLQFGPLFGEQATSFDKEEDALLFEDAAFFIDDDAPRFARSFPHQRERAAIRPGMRPSAQKHESLSPPAREHQRTARRERTQPLDFDEELETDLYQAMRTARPYLAPSRRRGAGSREMSYGLPMPRQVPNFLRDYGGLISIALVSLIIIVALWPNSTLRMMFWNPVAAALGISEPSPLPANPAGDYRLRGGPSVTPKQIDRILASYGSPAQGTGQIWYNLGLEYRIDPAFAVAFFIHESSAGTHPGWAGWIDRPGGQHTHNVGNIICAGYHRCHGRFRHYANWEEGIADWYRLISVEYIEGRGTETVAEIIPIYAPAFENDVAQYVGTVERLVDRWRQGNIP